MAILRKQLEQLDGNQFALRKSNKYAIEDILVKILNKGDVLELDSWEFDETPSNESPNDLSTGFNSMTLDLSQQKTLYEYLKKKFE